MPTRTVRYAVIGLGHLAQVAVLPAFAHAAQNSRVTALVSGNPTKLKQVSKRYGIAHQGRSARSRQREYYCSSVSEWGTTLERGICRS